MPSAQRASVQPCNGERGWVNEYEYRDLRFSGGDRTRTLVDGVLVQGVELRALETPRDQLLAAVCKRCFLGLQERWAF